MRGKILVEVISRRTTVLRVVGDADADATLVAEAALGQVRAVPPKRLSIDATATTSIDPSVITALARVACAVREQGGAVTMQASPLVRRVVHSCGIDHYLGLPKEP